jgi:hypothetical protein
MSFAQQDPSITPEQRLADLDHARDALMISVQENRRAAEDRRSELLRMIRDGDLDPSYDVEGDHRIASLLAGADRWETDVRRTAEQAEALRQSLLGRPIMRSRARRPADDPNGGQS